MATETTSGQPTDPYQIDRRLTILETRFDTILPTLATKADLAELTDGIARWVAKLFVTMVLGFAGVLATMLSLLRP